MPTRRTILHALLGTFLAILVFAAVGWWLAGLTPGWYQPVQPDNAAALALGETAEYRLVEEFQRIRPTDDVWRLRIPEAAINAWLATRLRQWLAGRGGVWPQELGSPQVRITPAGITVGVSADAIGGRVGLLTLSPSIADGQLQLRPVGGVGRLPIGIPTSLVLPHIADEIDADNSIAFIHTLLQGKSTPSTIPLVDHRAVRLHSVTLEPANCVIEASTRSDR
jgi:hypothetical protein